MNIKSLAKSWLKETQYKAAVMIRQLVCPSIPLCPSTALFGDFPPHAP